jgi:hypothetical protein
LWREWNGLGEEPSEQTKALWAYGHEHEKDAVGFYESETGEIVSLCLDRQVFVPYEEWSGCTPDGLVGDDGLLECKCPQRLWEVPPDYYWLQCQSQIAITGRRYADLCAWTPDGGRIWRTERDLAYWDAVGPILKACWEQLRSPTPPKKSAKPKFDWSIKWTAIG